MAEKSRDILWFADGSRSDIPVLGGKGANLAEMTNADFPVPNGFVVTSQAYFKFLDETGIRQQVVKLADSIDVDDTARLERTAEQIRTIVKNTPMSEALKIGIRKAYRQLSEKKIAWMNSSEPALVAVRSSATAEDLPTASFAGQQETYLNIQGDLSLLKAVQNCWASLFTARAVYYRKKQGFSTQKVGIAVVVQKMVESDQSGIMFTADPLGDRSKIVVEACFGLGEAIVSGSITPDTFTLDKESLDILDRKISYQAWMLKKSGRDNMKIALDKAKGGRQKVPDETIQKIAELGREIEDHYNAPQDIEWAIEGGKIFIVQSRAITTLGLEKKVAAEETREKSGDASGKIIVKGLAASPGIASGKVKIVPDARDVELVGKGDILVTVMTNPDWVPVMRKSSAIVTDEGGVTCHAAIVSRELGIPCVVGAGNATSVLRNGMIVTVNGFAGTVLEGRAIVQPAPQKAGFKKPLFDQSEVDDFEKALEEKIAALHAKARQKKSGALQAREKAGLEGVEKQAGKLLGEFGKIEAEKMPEKALVKEEALLEGVLRKAAISVKVNVALPDAAERAAQTNADGVGLLRAEHMITASGKHPAEFIREGKEKELKEAVKEGILRVASAFRGKPVWYRTFDARTDEFKELDGGDKEPEEENPMIGWHGIRRDLDEPELLKAQFLAIKELREEGYANVGVMLPFVIRAEEVRKAKEIAQSVGLPADEMEFGVMIETPAAAWTIDEIIGEGIAFVSFGTNDLTQLTLGIDRNNGKIQKLFSELHPAILRQLEFVIKKCSAAGVKTSICGQAASNPEMVKKLIRMGIGSVSANIDAVEEIRKIAMLEEKNLILEKSRKNQ